MVRNYNPSYILISQFPIPFRNLSIIYCNITYYLLFLQDVFGMHNLKAYLVFKKIFTSFILKNMEYLEFNLIEQCYKTAWPDIKLKQVQLASPPPSFPSPCWVSQPLLSPSSIERTHIGSVWSPFNGHNLDMRGVWSLEISAMVWL